MGHQEAILDAILLLDDTVREIRFGSLKSTAKKLFEKCLKLQNLRNPMQNDRPIGGHGFPLDTINSSQLSNKVCSIKNRSIFNEVQIRVMVLPFLFLYENGKITINIYRNNLFDIVILNLIGLISYQFQKSFIYLFLAFRIGIGSVIRSSSADQSPSILFDFRLFWSNTSRPCKRSCKIGETCFGTFQNGVTTFTSMGFFGTYHELLF